MHGAANCAEIATAVGAGTVTHISAAVLEVTAATAIALAIAETVVIVAAVSSCRMRWSGTPTHCLTVSHALAFPLFSLPVTLLLSQTMRYPSLVNRVSASARLTTKS